MLSRADKIVLTAAAAVVVTSIVVGRFDLVPKRPICWSVILLGRECAGCGLTRSFAATARGDLVAAVGFNWAGPLLLGTIALAGLARIVKAAAPRFRYWAEVDIALALVAGVTLVTRLLVFYFL